MSYSPVESLSHQKKILSECFRNGASTEQGFRVALSEGPDFVGLKLSREGESGRPLLYIRTTSRGGGTPAGLLAIKDGVAHLLHDGRSRKIGFPNLYSKTVASINGRQYYYIGPVDSELVPRIIAYHGSRVEIHTEDAKVLGFNPGPSGELTVPEHQRNREATHFKICWALREFVENLGWTVSKVSGCAPDLVVERHKTKILFEVKPSGGLQNIATAIGELLIYSETVKPDLRIIVCPKDEGTYTKTNGLLSKHEILWFSVESFSEFETALATCLRNRGNNG